MLRDRLHKSQQKTAFNLVAIVAIPLILFATIWYGLNHLLSYVLLTPTPRLTLLIHLGPTVSNEVPAIWLLVEGKKSVPRYFSLATRSELSTGMTPGLTVATLATALNDDIVPQIARTGVSQALGLPIDQVVPIASTENTWPAVVRELRLRAVAAVQAGALTDASIRYWLVARMSEGDSQPQDPETIISQISRQNLEPITTQENCPVAVLNNSGKAGFANLVGKIIEQSGGTVLRVANALPVSESQIMTSPTSQVVLHPDEVSNCTGTVAALSKLLSEPAISENQALADQYRSSVVVVLAPDAALVAPAPTEVAPDPRL